MTHENSKKCTTLTLKARNVMLTLDPGEVTISQTHSSSSGYGNPSEYPGVVILPDVSPVKTCRVQGVSVKNQIEIMQELYEMII